MQNREKSLIAAVLSAGKYLRKKAVKAHFSHTFLDFCHTGAYFIIRLTFSA